MSSVLSVVKLLKNVRFSLNIQTKFDILQITGGGLIVEAAETRTIEPAGQVKIFISSYVLRTYQCPRVSKSNN